MATYYPTTSAQAVKLYGRKLFVESLKATYANKFMGTSSSSLIQIQSELSKGPGDTLYYSLRGQLKGRGVNGDGTMEGNEENLVVTQDSVVIDQLRNAVRSGGRMSDQRIVFDIREEAKTGLTDWFADRYDSWFFNQICGFTAQSDTAYTGNNAVVAPDTAHYVNAHGAGSNDENLINTDTFKLQYIDYAVAKAKTLTTPIRPLRVNGDDRWVMFLHPDQVTDLKTNNNVSTGVSWYDIQRSTLNGGAGDNAGIFTGALGEYNGVILHEAVRVTNGVNSSTGAAIGTVRRAVLCGAQAAVMAFGQDNSEDKMEWVEEDFDYKNQYGISAGTIAGMKKTRFNSADFGTVVVSTYAAAAY